MVDLTENVGQAYMHSLFVAGSIGICGSRPQLAEYRAVQLGVAYASSVRQQRSKNIETSPGGSNLVELIICFGTLSHF